MQTADVSNDVFDEQFVLFDHEHEPIVNFPYTVKFESGAFEYGVTDEQGRTKRYVTDGPQLLEVYLGHVDPLEESAPSHPAARGKAAMHALSTGKDRQSSAISGK